MGERATLDAKTDFNAFAAKYEVLQRKAWATQNVDEAAVQELHDALDTYMTTHADTQVSQALQTKLDATLDSMRDTVVAERTHGTKNNTSWDTDTHAMESLLAELAPESADAIYSPTTKSAGTSPKTTAPETKVPAGASAKPITGDQSSAGWGTQDLLDPKTSSTYKGLSLDALLSKSDSLVAKTMGNQPDIVAAIRRVTQETGVPSGLLAAMVVQESNGRRETSSWNPGYGFAPGDQQFDWGIIQSPLWKFAGNSTAEKKRNAEDPYTNLKMFADEATQTYAETGSWGQAAQKWYTGSTAERLGGVTGGASDESNYVLNVFKHLGMGGQDYYPQGGY